MNEHSNNDKLVAANVPTSVRTSGNPYSSHAQDLRAALVNAVTPEDIAQIIKLQVFLARKGDTFATREILDRTLGRSVAMDVLMRLEAIENQIAEIRGNK